MVKLQDWECYDRKVSSSLCRAVEAGTVSKNLMSATSAMRGETELHCVDEPHMFTALWLASVGRSYEVVVHVLVAFKLYLLS